MHPQHAAAAAPEETGEARHQRSADQETEAEGQREPREDPEEEGTVEEADRRVRDQVRRIAVALAALRVDEQPADVGVEEAAEGAAPPAPVTDVGAVRVALLVREGVVLAVVGDP